MNIQVLLIRFVFWVVGIVSGYFSLRMISMFIYRTFEKKVESKKNATPPSFRPGIFFSILIPARNEGGVIEKTLAKMCEIHYPTNQFEIYIITDAKEKPNQLELTTYERANQFIQNHTGVETPQIHLIDVPEGFDGKMDGIIHPYPINSTKGRALNYCMSKIQSKGKFHILSFFDAESHPDPSILIRLAAQLSLEEDPSVYQGPLFQVRNFWRISLFSKVVALTQAFAHEYSLPMILKWIPFLGGTNMHIPLSVMQDIKGFSNTTITEDLELGVRLSLLKNIKPLFIDIPSNEQSPITIKGYFHQRSRWGSGNIDTLTNIYKQIKEAKEHSWKAKLLILFIKLCAYGPGEWITYFCVGLIVSLTYLNLLWKSLHIFANLFSFSYHFYPYIFFCGLKLLITIPMLLSGFFVILLYFRYASYIQDAWKTEHIMQLFIVYLFSILVLPFMGWMYAFPFVYACFSHWFGRSQKIWIKTERTQEI